MAKIHMTFEIEDDHKAFLNAMAKAHALPSIDKALRVLLDYASHEGDRDAIFGVVRCRHC